MSICGPVRIYSITLKGQSEFSPIRILSFIHARIIPFQFERAAGHA